MKEGDVVHPKGKYRRDDAIDFDQYHCRFRQFKEMNNWDYFDDIPDYHPIADANNLYEAFKAARKGSHWKTQVQRFRWNVGTEIGKLQRELHDLQTGGRKPYELSAYSKFPVNERGKTRAITALSMRDRVVKHTLNDLYLIPHIRPHLIYDNGASLEEKGVSFTRNRLVAHLESYFREYGTNDGYIMTMDFSGYYDNIDHELAKKMIRKYEPDKFARLLTEQAYDSYRIDVSFMNDEEYAQAVKTKFSMVEYRKEHINENRGKKFLNKSLSVGDQTSQITAISFPTPIDNTVKIIYRQKYYARYMDDLYVIARTKEELEGVRKGIQAVAEDLKIIINPRKTKITKLCRSFTFLQFKYYLAENGHVVIRINPKSVTRMKRKLKKLRGLVDSGKARKEKVDVMFCSWIGEYGPKMSGIQKKGIIELYRKLFGGGLDEWMKTRKLL